jgi:hypothetical protein
MPSSLYLMVADIFSGLCLSTEVQSMEPFFINFCSESIQKSSFREKASGKRHCIHIAVDDAFMCSAVAP